MLDWLGPGPRDGGRRKWWARGSGRVVCARSWLCSLETRLLGYDWIVLFFGARIEALVERRVGRHSVVWRGLGIKALSCGIRTLTRPNRST